MLLTKTLSAFLVTGLLAVPPAGNDADENNQQVITAILDDIALVIADNTVDPTKGLSREELAQALKDAQALLQNYEKKSRDQARDQATALLLRNTAQNQESYDQARGRRRAQAGGDAGRRAQSGTRGGRRAQAGSGAGRRAHGGDGRGALARADESAYEDNQTDTRIDSSLNLARIYLENSQNLTARDNFLSALVGRGLNTAKADSSNNSRVDTVIDDIRLSRTDLLSLQDEVRQLHDEIKDLRKLVQDLRVQVKRVYD